MQSRHMADALVTSIGADPRARAMLGASEIAYAVDAQAASIRETLATLYLSILPAGVGCIAGAVSILVMGGVPELVCSPISGWKHAADCASSEVSRRIL